MAEVANLPGTRYEWNELNNLQWIENVKIRQNTCPGDVILSKLLLLLLARIGTQSNRKRSLEVVLDTPTLIVLSGKLKKQFPEFTYSYKSGDRSKICFTIILLICKVTGFHCNWRWKLNWYECTWHSISLPTYPKFSPVCVAGEVLITSTLHITWRQKIGFPSKPFIWDIHDILEQFL